MTRSPIFVVGPEGEVAIRSAADLEATFDIDDVLSGEHEAVALPAEDANVA